MNLPDPIQDRRKGEIEGGDLFIHRRRDSDLAVINFVSVDGSVNYRIKGKRRCYYSKRENFLRNWTKLELLVSDDGDEG